MATGIKDRNFIANGSRIGGRWDKSDRWCEKSAWFTSIIYQPEDKIVADYNLYGQWCREAYEKAGIDCFELIGWDSGGLERNYPDYTPEEKLGGKKGFRKLLKEINESGGSVLLLSIIIFWTKTRIGIKKNFTVTRTRISLAKRRFGWAGEKAP